MNPLLETINELDKKILRLQCARDVLAEESGISFPKAPPVDNDHVAPGCEKFSTLPASTPRPSKPFITKTAIPAVRPGRPLITEVSATSEEMVGIGKGLKEPFTTAAISEVASISRKDASNIITRWVQLDWITRKGYGSYIRKPHFGDRTWRKPKPTAEPLTSNADTKGTNKQNWDTLAQVKAEMAAKKANQD